MKNVEWKACLLKRSQINNLSYLYGKESRKRIVGFISLENVWMQLKGRLKQKQILLAPQLSAANLERHLH